MTPQELEQLSEEQKTKFSKVNIDECKGIKAHVESEHAAFVVRKQITPFTRWYLENLKDNSQINLEVGDQLELIDLEQSFSLSNEYKGTTRNTILEMGAKFIKLKTPDPHALLISEDAKIFAINKPLYKGEFNAAEEMMRLLQQETATKNENVKKLTQAVTWTLLIALIVIVIVVLV